MTTESMHRTRQGALVLLGAACAALLAGAGVAVAALALEGAAAGGAALGLALATVVVMALGGLFVNAVAGTMPAVSLLVALVTYAFQLTVLTVVLVGVSRAADERVTGWAAGAVGAVTLTWTVGHLVLATRRRIPVYDLASGPGTASGADAPPGRPRAGAR